MLLNNQKKAPAHDNMINSMDKTMPSNHLSSDESKESSPNMMPEKQDIESSASDTAADTASIVQNPAPDGGLEAWLVVSGAWCASFCSFGWINSVGVFQEYFQTHLLKQYSASAISWIACFEIFFMLGMSPIVGKLYDSYGPRWLLLGGTFLHVFGLMMASISTEYYQLLLSQGICSAIGASAIFLPSFNCVVGYFDKKRAAAFGILVTGSSIGGIIFPIMLSRLIVQVGFGWAMRISAFIILTMLTIANITIKSRLPPRPKSISFREFIIPFTELAFSLSVFGNFLFSFGVFIPVTYIVVEATAMGMNTVLAQYLIAMLNGASLFGRLSAGLIADKIGRFNVFVFVSTGTGVLILALWIPAASSAAVIVFAVLFGFFSGAYASLGPALVAQISPIQDIGIRTGLFFAVSSIAGLVSGPVAGAILSNWDVGFLGVKIFAGVLCLAGAIFVLWARIHKTGFKLMDKF